MQCLNFTTGIILSLLVSLATAADIPAIAAASSLQAALEDISTQFRKATGKSVRLAYGSSGNFYRQLNQGAPFQLFFSADENYAIRLVQTDKTLEEGQLYAVGRLVLFISDHSSIALDEHGQGLQTALASGQLQRFAIANPDHAPYGHAAKEALQSLGLWEQIKPKLVFGENVSQAAQFAVSGSTQGGIFAYSLARIASISNRGSYILLPADLHSPLRQRMVLLKNAGETAQQFYNYVQQPAARAILQRYGFTLPNKID